MKNDINAENTNNSGEKFVVGSRELAQCIGLWLAEGDDKTNAEITFTNNNLELVQLFRETVEGLFPGLNPRIYAYDKTRTGFTMDGVIIREYIDERANRPYYIYRVASRKATKQWKQLAEEYTSNPEYYAWILQGFFAGEGNIKYSLKHNYHRSIRISQGSPIPLIEKMLAHYCISWKYTPRNRMYNITGFGNLAVADKISLTCLHSDKHEKFKEMISTITEEHYGANYLKTQVYNDLKEPATAQALSKKYQRSFARIQDVLIELKKERSIQNYHIGSRQYWIRTDRHVIIISPIKKQLLDCLETPKRTFEVAKALKRRFESTEDRLRELEKLGLAERRGKAWHKKEVKEETICLS